ncbi:MAG: hypothetical protein ABF335_08415 [Alphaproteobacteria bacterium]
MIYGTVGVPLGGLGRRMNEHSRAFFWVIFVILLFLAWTNRFIQDDAFISFRYAQNLVNGHGLVFNPGEAVEGYTNFLWTLIIAIPLYFDKDVIVSSYLISMGIFAIGLGGVYRLADLMLENKTEALLALLLVGTNYTFSAYATGGLETTLVMALIVWAFALSIEVIRSENWSLGKLLLISLLSGLALLTRLDAAIFLFAVAMILGLSWVTNGAGATNKIAQAFAITIPALLLVGGWFIWKLDFYGDILPNTYYAKAARDGLKPELHLRGVHFIYLYLARYALWPLLAIFFWQTMKRRPALSQTALSVVLVLWFAYIIWTGGDFMEFRFMVVATPLIMIMAVTAMRSLPKLHFPLIAILLGVSALHGGTFARTGGIESIDELHQHVTGPPNNWIKVGQSMKTHFGDLETPPVVALGAAGAMPYYSELEVIDLLGLVDKWVAHHGETYVNRPGHMRVGNHSYAIERGTNFWVGQISGIKRLDDGSIPCRLSNYKDYFQFVGAVEDVLPDDLSFIALPVDEQWVFPILYIHPTLQIDDAIKSHGLTLCPIERS